MVNKDKNLGLWFDRSYLPLAFVLVVTLVVYNGVFHAEYVWDDIMLFLDNSGLRNSENFFESVSRPILPGSTYFRPLVLGSFVLEFNLFGVASSVSHAVNLGLHLINVSLIYILASCLLGGRFSVDLKLFGAFSASAFYALHPALIEPVVWVAGRFDLMVTTFCLAGLVAAVSLKGMFRSTLVGVSFFFAACSKEMAITFPIILLGVLFAQSASAEPLLTQFRYLLRKYWLDWLFVLGFGFIYLMLRVWAMPSVYSADASINTIFVGIEKLYMVFNTVYFYVKMALFPFLDIGPLHPLFKNLYHYQIAIGGLICVITFLAIIYLCIKKRVESVVFFCLFIVALAPVSQVIPLTIGGNIGHERFLAFPLVMFSLMVAYVLASLRISFARYCDQDARRFNLYLYSFFGGWTLFSIITVLTVIPLWSKDLNLWAWAYEKDPDIPFAQVAFIASATRFGEYELVADLANEVSQESVDNKEQSIIQHNVLGFYFTRTGEFDKAKMHLKKAIEQGQPPHLEYVSQGVNLGSIEFDPSTYAYSAYYRDVYHYLSEIALSEGDYGLAIEDVAIAQFYQVDYAPSWLILAMAQVGSGNYDASELSLAKSLSYVNVSSRSDISRIYTDFVRVYCENKKHNENFFCQRSLAEATSQ